MGYSDVIELSIHNHIAMQVLLMQTWGRMQKSGKTGEISHTTHGRHCEVYDVTLLLHTIRYMHTRWRRRLV